MQFRKKTTVNERYVIAAKVKPKVLKNKLKSITYHILAEQSERIWRCASFCCRFQRSL